MSSVANVGTYIRTHSASTTANPSRPRRRRRCDVPLSASGRRFWRSGPGAGGHAPPHPNSDFLDRRRRGGSRRPRARCHLSGAVHLRAVSRCPRAPHPPAWGGDTRAQTAGVLRSIEASLRRSTHHGRRCALGRFFLVGDPGRGGRMDFECSWKAYREHFRARPRSPTFPCAPSCRSRAGAPGWLSRSRSARPRPRYGHFSGSGLVWRPENVPAERKASPSCGAASIPAYKPPSSGSSAGRVLQEQR
jgi:hypothetical protein